MGSVMCEGARVPSVVHCNLHGEYASTARNAVHKARKLGRKTQHVSQHMMYQYCQVHGTCLPGTKTGAADLKGILSAMRPSRHLDLA